ncbi:MAG: hypothetical protein J7623_13125 [Chitinophaga sp.]|uniref:hypothetical protein n=1 Tax=Chitinophaga sp. TaxID=1869181 RepID=UPI001AFF1974|nr:hypothetical protein [Chitinophaga sp.]MBO9729573.1 hypothetical protein [Chitinophaga sp.]
MQLEWFQYFQIASLLTAIICWRGLARFSLLAFIPILIITNITETLGANIRSLGLANSYNIYNIYILLVTPFYLYVYRKMLLMGKNEKKVFIIIAGLCMCFLLLNFLFMQGPQQFDSYSAMLIELLNIVFCSLILLRLLMVENEETILYGTPYYWISASTLLFSIVALVALGLQPYIIREGITLWQRSLYRALLPVANAFLYSGYIYSFILCSKAKKK